VEEASLADSLAGPEQIAESRAMSQANDVWYVRFPDGRVMRASTTEAVRFHLETGRIPRTSLVRRSPEEEWTALEWAPEFVDLLQADHPRGPSDYALLESEPLVSPSPPQTPRPVARRTREAREGRMQLHTIGARGMVEEMLGALDSTLVRLKLRIACAMGLTSMVILVLIWLLVPFLDWPWTLLPQVGTGIGLLVIWAMGSTLITQATFTELSHARSAGWADARTGLGRHSLRLTFALLLVVGIPILVIILLRKAPEGLENLELIDPIQDWGTALALVLRLVLWVFLGLWISFSLLLAPILIVEECSIGQGLRLWWQFLRQHFSRAYLYEALTATMAAVASLPLMLPVVLGPWPGSVPAAAATLSTDLRLATLSILAGLALTPLIAFLIVANLFIYLNLRYEQGYRR
jgi:hypothetical protein